MHDSRDIFFLLSFFFGWGRKEEKKEFMELVKRCMREGIFAWACTLFVCGVISIWGGGFRIFIRCCFVYFLKYLWIYIYPGANICSVENGCL